MIAKIRWFVKLVREVLRSPFVQFARPGHFYSPLPRLADVQASAASRFGRQGFDETDVGVVNLDSAGQLALIKELAKTYADLPYADMVGDTGGLRYSFDNDYFRYSDAVYLYSLLRYLKPRRLVEIGSGYSSAVTLDVRERFLAGAPECIFVEPFPGRLNGLLRGGDRETCRILECGVQEVDLEVFRQLESGDVLFIDSSHVTKFQSDVNFLFFKVFPILADGVWIHVHDIFFPFEYPREWLIGGRAWNEAYLLRAFLMNNSDYQVRLWADFAGRRFETELRELMPMCLRDTGGSIWIEKVGRA